MNKEAAKKHLLSNINKPTMAPNKAVKGHSKAAAKAKLITKAPNKPKALKVVGEKIEKITVHTIAPKENLNVNVKIDAELVEFAGEDFSKVFAIDFETDALIKRSFWDTKVESTHITEPPAPMTLADIEAAKKLANDSLKYSRVKPKGKVTFDIEKLKKIAMFKAIS